MSYNKRSAASAAGRLFLIVLAGILMASCLPGCSSRYRDPQRYRTQASRPRPAIADGPVFLRIGLVTRSDRVELEMQGAVRLTTSDRGRILADLEAGDRVSVTVDGNNLSWSAPGRPGRSGLAESLLLTPGDPGTLIIWSEDPFPGEMRLSTDQGGITLVNVVELEQYLRGVVPWEIGRTTEEGLAALEAQAIAARTYSISHLGEREDLGFDMWASVMDQVYRGHRGLDAICDRAVAGTQGQVLKHDGVEIEAYYCSTCGGVTSNIHEVWAREAKSYLRTHADRIDGEDFCRDSSQYRWESTWSVDELTRVLRESLPEYGQWLAASPMRTRWSGTFFKAANDKSVAELPGRLLEIRIRDRTSSGRVSILELKTESGTYRVRGDRTRWVLKPVGERFSILRSAFFDIEPDYDAQGRLQRIKVKGKGFGHGIGMCQTGALQMARSGYTSREILAHYYPGARIVKVDRR